MGRKVTPRHSGNKGYKNPDCDSRKKTTQAIETNCYIFIKLVLNSIDTVRDSISRQNALLRKIVLGVGHTVVARFFSIDASGEKQYKSIRHLELAVLLDCESEDSALTCEETTELIQRLVQAGCGISLEMISAGWFWKQHKKSLAIKNL